jgi:hypothetical protein
MVAPMTPLLDGARIKQVAHNLAFGIFLKEINVVIP